MRVYRRETFNAAHRIYNPKWSDEKNSDVFGKCSNPNYHGHNYKFEICIEGPINQETGYVIDLKELKKVIQDEVCERFDHKNLNMDCVEFANIIPSAENISIVIWNLLRPHVNMDLKMSVKLWETEKNSVEYDGK